MKLTFILALLFISCSKSENDSKQKVYNEIVVAKIKGMDPIFANDRYSSNEIARVYEGLLDYHYLKRPFTLEPGLAESMPTVSKDGLTYTFKLREGVLFHDNACFPGGIGRELTADDVRYSILRVADPKLQSTGWWVLDGKVKGLNEWRDKYADAKKANYNDTIPGLKVLDKYRIQFTLSRPFPQFLYAMAMPFYYIVAKEAVEHYGKEFLNHPVGTGAYTLDKFRQTNKITYMRNPKYRDARFPTEGPDRFKKLIDSYGGKKLPFIDKVIVHIIQEEQPRWLNFKRGKIDILRIPKDNFEAAITPSKDLSPDLKKAGVNLIIEPALDLTYIAFNHEHPLFKDNIKLRQAMSMAYNGDKANELFYNSTGLPAQSLVPPGIKGHLEGYINPYQVYNLEKAKKLLAEAGYPGGKGLPPITYDTSASTVYRQMGEYFAKQMGLLGINIQVTNNPWPTLQKKIRTKQVMLYGIAWGADYPDAENFLQLLYGPNKSPGANGSNFDDPKFNRLFKKSSLMQDTPERTKFYKELNRYAAEKVPYIFGVHRQYYYLTHRYLKNFVVSDFEQGRERFLDIDMVEKKEVLKSL